MDTKQDTEQEYTLLPDESIVLKGEGFPIELKKNPALLIVAVLLIVAGIITGIYIWIGFLILAVGLLLLGPGIYLAVRQKKIRETILYVTTERIIGQAHQSPSNQEDASVSLPLSLLLSASLKGSQVGVVTKAGFYLFKGLENAAEVFQILAQRCQMNSKKGLKD